MSNTWFKNCEKNYQYKKNCRYLVYVPVEVFTFIIIVVFICFSIFLQLYIFEDAVKNGFKIGKPKDNSIDWVWDDGSKKWYNDIPFFYTRTSILTPP